MSLHPLKQHLYTNSVRSPRARRAVYFYGASAIHGASSSDKCTRHVFRL